jgi:hypothetical protein
MDSTRYYLYEVLTRPVPGHCIWCRALTPPDDRRLSDVSYVLPACLGNERGVLPPGIVCRRCNNSFGTRLEPILLDFAPLRMSAALLEVVDPRDGKLFRDTILGHTPIPDAPSEVIDVLIDRPSPTTLVVNLRRPVVLNHTASYDARWLRLLSRAVHKFLFETIALKVYVLGHAEPVDLFDTAFDHVRKWVRRGEPQGPARPWLWQFPSQDLLQSWYVEPLHQVHGRAIARARVYGNWFLADLTSDHHDVPASLSDGEPAADIFCIADTIEPTAR